MIIVQTVPHAWTLLLLLTERAKHRKANELELASLKKV